MVMILSPPRNIFVRQTIQTLGGFLAWFLNTNNQPRLSQKKILKKPRRPNMCHRCNRGFWAFITSSIIFHLQLCYGYQIWVFFLAGSSNSEMIFHLAYHVCLDKLIAARGGTNHPLCQLVVFFEVQTLPSLGRTPPADVVDDLCRHRRRWAHPNRHDTQGGKSFLSLRNRRGRILILDSRNIIVNGRWLSL